MEVFPGIHQLRLALVNNPAGYVNCYLIKNATGCMLIDTGWNDPQLFDDLHKQLNNLDVGFENIEQIIYTHIHPDHFGLAGKLKQLYGTKLSIHQYGTELIEYRYVRRKRFIQELGNWHIQNGGSTDHRDEILKMSTDYTDHVAPVIPDTLLSDCDIINAGNYQFEVLWTPGHDSDHICLYERKNKILFSGDHILPDTVTHLGMHYDDNFEQIINYVNSLKAISELEVDIVLPGHEHSFTELYKRIEQLLVYHQRIFDQIKDTLTDKPTTAYALAEKIDWLENGFIWKDMPPLVQAGLATKTLAYLKTLVMESYVQRVDKNGLTVYNSI